MELRNRQGTPVDPVPFLVVAGLSFMLLLSFGPLYGQALGTSLEVAIAGSFGLFLAVVALAYYWQVWTARPRAVHVQGVPVGIRAERLFYLMIVLAAIVVGLALPLLI